MKWIKQGLIVQPQYGLDWMVTHAMVPVAMHLQDYIYRIYFSGRDKHNRSHIGYVEIDIREPRKILRISEHPSLGLGDLGCFDDNGVTPSWIVDHNNKRYLFYIGWNMGSTTRMGLIAGLAISYDGGTSFHRVSRAPILERTDSEPYSLMTGPCVIIENDIWRMWYVSGVEWANKDMPRYNIKYAESKDGITWNRSGLTCIDFKGKENALARPCVLKENSIYRMWYSYKGEYYRIGYAESPDGFVWERKDDEVGIDVSPSSWDSEMIEYAFVFDHRDTKYMLYNGNDYGTGGIGLAIMEDD
ncbi:MAG: hypothetical protein HOC20_09420 [Chloroflexi bacterium]|jgi:hypothetical protein|nr:hypothetical protein [Chloroflexota bacterium]